MKRITILFSLSALLCAVVLYGISVWKNNIPEVDVVSVKTVEYTESITAGGEIISDGGIFYAEVLVPENRIASVKAGQKAVVSGNAFAENEYSATVEEISSTAVKRVVGTAQSTVIIVKVRLDETDELVRTGCTAKARIFTAESRDVEVLPYEAIDVDNDGNEFVYVFNSGVCVKKEIDTGVEFSGGVEVTDGLGYGDYVILSDDELSDGEYVSISEGE